MPCSAVLCLMSNLFHCQNVLCMTWPRGKSDTTDLLQMCHTIDLCFLSRTFWKLNQKPLSICWPKLYLMTASFLFSDGILNTTHKIMSKWVGEWDESFSQAAEVRRPPTDKARYFKLNHAKVIRCLLNACAPMQNWSSWKHTRDYKSADAMYWLRGSQVSD